MFLLSSLPPGVKARLRAFYAAGRLRLVRAFRSYGTDELAECLRALGVQAGDNVMLHSAFSAHFGFTGSIEELTDTFLAAIGPRGHLFMVSLPYRTSSLQYLSTLKQFDVLRTPSMMGLVSEYFRRRPAVVRSLHPTHPILVHGPRAEEIVARHPECLHPCGPGTPFDHLLALDGKVVFFNVEFAVFTFFHYLEHLVSGDLPFSLYTDRPSVVPVVDRHGNARTVTTFVYSPEAIQRRRFAVLEAEFRRRGLIKTRRIGNGAVEAIRVREAVDCVEDMRRQGRYFYDFAGLPGGAGEVSLRNAT
jgi:aminoglycoside 3-N-acetyltransferase